MKKLFVSLVAALSIGASLSAIAGPDWQTIEQARKAKAEQITGTAAPSTRLLMPLDHGPRAQSTPWLNRQYLQRLETDASTKAALAGSQRKAEFSDSTAADDLASPDIDMDQMMKDCMEMMKKST